MKHVAAYLLCQLGGNSKPSEADVNKILSSVGIEADSDKLGKLLSSLEGKDLVEVLAAGKAKMATMPSGGGGGEFLWWQSRASLKGFSSGRKGGMMG